MSRTMVDVLDAKIKQQAKKLLEEGGYLKYGLLEDAVAPDFAKAKLEVMFIYVDGSYRDIRTCPAKYKKVFSWYDAFEPIGKGRKQYGNAYITNVIGYRKLPEVA